MDEVGIQYEVMELDTTPDGPAIQDIMLSMTGEREKYMYMCERENYMYMNLYL